MPIGNKLGDMLLEMRDPNLSPQRQDEIIRLLNELGDREIKYNAWLDVKGNVDWKFLNLPFFPIYSEVLATAKASLIIEPKGNFKHLILYGAGGISTANGGNIWAQFNDDTGNNYQWQTVSADNTTVGAGHDLSDPYAVLGVFGTTGAGAGVTGSFIADIPHFQSRVWFKTLLSRFYTGEFNTLYHGHSQWNSLSPISKIEIFGTDNTLAKGTANLVAGCVFSLYGLL